jgi:hypothetical protein
MHSCSDRPCVQLLGVVTAVVAEACCVVRVSRAIKACCDNDVCCDMSAGALQVPGIAVAAACNVCSSNAVTI